MEPESLRAYEGSTFVSCSEGVTCVCMEEEQLCLGFVFEKVIEKLN